MRNLLPYFSCFISIQTKFGFCLNVITFKCNQCIYSVVSFNSMSFRFLLAFCLLIQFFHFHDCTVFHNINISWFVHILYNYLCCFQLWCVTNSVIIILCVFMNKLPFLWNIYPSMGLLSYRLRLFFALLDTAHPFPNVFNSSYNYILALHKNSSCSIFSQHLFRFYNFFKCAGCVMLSNCGFN